MFDALITSRKCEGAKAIDQQVVDKRTVRSGQRGVLNLANLQLAGVVARDVLDGRQRILAGNLYLAHMRDVE
jgi:hypothetical protein